LLKFPTTHPPIHPTQKPVPLLEYLIKTYTNENETVLDFTFGSGTTLVAAINTNRKSIGIELDEKYFDMACKRLEQAVKNKEVLNDR
jgi:site-specific DNA-methyltransferase (adenine-specific)